MAVEHRYTYPHSIPGPLLTICLVAFGSSQTLFRAALLARLQAVGHYHSLAHSGLMTKRKTSFHYKKKFIEVDLQECFDKEGFFSSLTQCATKLQKFKKHVEKSSKTRNK